MKLELIVRKMESEEDRTAGSDFPLKANLEHDQELEGDLGSNYDISCCSACN